MPALTIATANSLLNALLRQTTFTSPGGIYLACYTAVPTSAGGGTEVAGGSYLRPSMTFTAPSGGACSNAVDINILAMPAATIRGLALLDATSGGNMLFYGVLATPKTTNAGDTFTVKAGDFNIAMA